MKNFIFFLLFISSSSAFSQTLPFSPSFCRAEIQKTLSGWQSLNQWENVAAHDPDDEVFQSPTSQIGVWIQIEKSKDSIHALRITAHTQLGLEWTAKKCVPELKMATNSFFKNEGPGDFTDEELAKLIHKSEKGAVLLWSPGMPYSVKGIEWARQAAKKEKLPLTLVLDSNADKKVAAKAATDLHLKPSEIQSNRSVELIFRKGENHFPTLLVYAHGKMAKEVLPGYALESLYEKFIQEQTK